MLFTYTGNLKNQLGLLLPAALLFLAVSGSAQTNSLSFDGTTGAVDLGDHYAFNLDSAFTIEAWIKTSGGPGGHQIVSKMGANYKGWAFLWYGDDSTLGFCQIRHYPDNARWRLAHAPLADNQWHHVAMVYDGGDDAFNLFLDGVELVPGSLGTVSGSVATTGQARIGCYEGDGTPGSFWTGQIDEVRIWNIMRGESEIIDHMHCPLTGSEPGLAGYWKLEEGSGVVTTDQSSAGLTGNLLDGASWNTDQALNCVTGIPGHPQGIGTLTIAPNPFSRSAVLSTGRELRDARLIICNSLGQTVRQKEHLYGSTVTMDRESLPKGVYFIQLTEGRTVFTGRFIID